MAGDTVTGVTIFQLEEGLDSGPVALSRAEPILPGRHARHAGRAARRARGDAADRGARPGRGGRARAATTAGGGRHLRREDRPGRAAPRPGAARPRSWSASCARSRPASARTSSSRTASGWGSRRRASRTPASSPGAVVAEDGRLLVGCAEGALELLGCGPPGGRSMPAADYLRGHRPARAGRLSMPTDARRCAYAVVRRVFEQDAYADRAFRAEADRLELDGRDRAFAMRLAYGVVQRRATLDHVIESLSDRAAGRIDAAGAGGAAARPLPAPVHGRRRRPRGGRGVRRARQGGAQPRPRVRERGAAPGHAGGAGVGGRRSASPRPRRPRCATRIPSGSRRPGGTSSAPSEARRPDARRTTSRPRARRG